MDMHERNAASDKVHCVQLNGPVANLHAARSWAQKDRRDTDGNWQYPILKQAARARVGGA